MFSWDEFLSPDPGLSQENEVIPVASDLIYSSLADIKNIPKQELYRLIVDGQFHKEENGWFKYGTREPNSLPACFDALQVALDIDTYPALSLDLIKKVHQSVTTRVLKLNAHTKPGELRNNCGGYFLVQNVHPFVSEQGFLQLSRKINETYLAHGACISLMTKSQAMGLNSSTFYEQLSALRNSTANVETLWEEISNLLPQNVVFYRAPSAATLPLLVQNMCDEYNFNIPKIDDPEEKLNIIARAVQELEQLHIFPDANGRTSLIILQRLLIQNGFFPAMLYNPNYLDGYSLIELVNEIKKGIECTKKIIDYPEQALYGYATKRLSLSINNNMYASKNEIIENYYLAEEKFFQFLQRMKVNFGINLI